MLFSLALNELISPNVKKGELPSGNIHASARGLARLASAMANKGKRVDGSILISEETWGKMHQSATLRLDAGLGKT